MLMKALRFRTFLIALVALAATFLLASFSTPDALDQQNAVPKLAVSQESTRLELVIAGPEAVPLPRKDWRPRFTAVLINHSKEPVAFLPTRRAAGWIGNRTTRSNATCTA
jgi:hypothetical protein